MAAVASAIIELHGVLAGNLNERGSLPL